MKKSIRSILVILILIALLIPITYSYAIEGIKLDNKEKSFFETSKLEYSKNEKVEMTINLEQIKYNKFVFELQSSGNMQNVEINSNENSKTLVAQKSENEIIIEIDKLTTNLSSITLYYQIPEKMQINDTIKFIATITNIETQLKEETTETEENKQEEIRLETDNNQKNNSEMKVESESETKVVEIKIGEQKAETNIDNENNSKNEEKSQNNMSNNTKKLSTQNSTTSQKISMTKSSSSKSISSTPTVTFNGSDNNYLSELSIEGYELNKNFSKENSTYFLTVENGVESLNVECTKDDSTSTVCIYGNEELATGTNKILISVTAENGNVRTYRIYVTKNS